jgi:bacteriocin-like protein
MPPKIKIKDLPKDEQVSEEELKKISGGLAISITPIIKPKLPSTEPAVPELPKMPGRFIDCW